MAGPGQPIRLEILKLRKQVWEMRTGGREIWNFSATPGGGCFDWGGGVAPPERGRIKTGSGGH